MELTALKDQLVEKIRTVANTTKLVSDFYVLVESVTINPVAARLTTFKLSERVATAVPCTLLSTAETTLRLAEAQYDNSIVPRQPLINAQNVLQAINDFNTTYYRILEIFVSNCGLDCTDKGYPGRVDAARVRFHNLRHEHFSTIDTAQNNVITTCAAININVRRISATDIYLPQYAVEYYSVPAGGLHTYSRCRFLWNYSLLHESDITHNYCTKKNEVNNIIITIQANIATEEANLAVRNTAQAELTRQTNLQTQRNTATDTFNTRATAMIALLTPPTTPTTNVTRQRIMLAKTGTLRRIYRNQDYTASVDITLSLIAEWWAANPRATPTAGNDTFNNAAQETELFLEMCDVFDADNETTTATGVFADRAHDFDSVASVTASMAASSFVTGVSRRSRASYASHPEAAQFFST